MQYRTFGRTGWQVSSVGYGMWGIGGWTGSDDDESLQSLQRAVDLGCNFFDTAWAYGEGHSERLLGVLVRQNSARKLYLATKIPPKNRRWPSRRGFTLAECFPADYVHEYVERSLENLGVDAIDLMQLHTWEDAWLDDPGWPDTLAALKAQNQVRAVGISINRWEPWNGVRAVASGSIDAVQVIYNIFDQNPRDELLPACEEHGVGVIARVPFDEGTLTGTLTLDSRWPEGDWRNTYFVPDNLRASVERAERLRPLVPEAMTMPELALRFILAEPRVSTIIPGMRKLRHVEANLAASDGAPLDPALLASLAQHRWDRQPTEWSQ